MCNVHSFWKTRYYIIVRLFKCNIEYYNVFSIVLKTIDIKKYSYKNIFDVLIYYTVIHYTIKCIAACAFNYDIYLRKVEFQD